MAIQIHFSLPFDKLARLLLASLGCTWDVEFIAGSRIELF